ncbi:hypothetical protein [Pseudomonas rubra]|uniref:Uncharacterized protein n=1 Tax=Pseudomonas rubra TaxID=2942627 RepID=A0ABT5PC58_9PSED|nr:hypothetical protein [Pseudomonas rubra]MDD1015883.1 hypothetical protein [Pseudomonas rubra]MDD1040213.1 hypothetical protein [Pseudomonas rubra]MDD1157911.1 hypothetical protein [Pseudomonas rubra]
MISATPLPSAGSPDTGLLNLLERIVAMAGAAVKWLLELAGTALDGLLGVAEAIGECLEQAMSWLLEVLKKPTVPDAHLLLEVRLDASTYALHQILLSPRGAMRRPRSFPARHWALSSNCLWR